MWTQNYALSPISRSEGIVLMRLFAASSLVLSDADAGGDQWAQGVERGDDHVHMRQVPSDGSGWQYVAYKYAILFAIDQ